MKIDFRMSEDGDLVLGEQLTNEQGELLYRDPSRLSGYTTEVSESTIPMRDVGIAYGDEVDIQMIRFRLNTDAPDYSVHPTLGANLSDLIGEMNTRATMEKGKAFILQALTYDGALSEHELEVSGIPYDQTKILYSVRLIREGRPSVRIPLLFDIELGIMNTYEVEGT